MNIDETPEILPIWLNLVTEQKVIGKRTHDARIVAVMIRSRINHILTLNPNDFRRLPGITIIHPQDIISL